MGGGHWVKGGMADQAADGAGGHGMVTLCGSMTSELDDI